MSGATATQPSKHGRKSFRSLDHFVLRVVEKNISKKMKIILVKAAGSFI